MKDTPLEVTVTTDARSMQKAVGDYVNAGKMREAVRLLYELIAGGDPRLKNWAFGHLPQKLYAAGEPAYAIVEYEKRPTNVLYLRDCARCYLAYDQYKKAVELAEASLKGAASSGQKDFDEAKACMALGDIYRKQEDFAKAKESYAKAGEAFQRMVNAGQNAALAGRSVALMKELDAMCNGLPTLDVSTLKDGTWQGRGSGYSGEVGVSVTIAGGKITGLDYTRQSESIPFSSLHDMKRLIVEKQSPSVDATTGATITSQAVMTAAYEALSKAKP